KPHTTTIYTLSLHDALPIYDITAKSEDDANEDQVGEMIKSLLGDRFKLTFHHETTELPVYALLVSKNGPKLKASDGDNHNANTRSEEHTSELQSRSDLVCRL